MATLSFKVAPDGARRIRPLARREKLSLSEYLRRRASGVDPSAPPIGHVRCDYTGARIFGAAEADPPLTTEGVREMLSEFP